MRCLIGFALGVLGLGWAAAQGTGPDLREEVWPGPVPVQVAGEADGDAGAAGEVEAGAAGAEAANEPEELPPLPTLPGGGGGLAEWSEEPQPELPELPELPGDEQEQPGLAEQPELAEEEQPELPELPGGRGADDAAEPEPEDDQAGGEEEAAAASEAEMIAAAPLVVIELPMTEGWLRRGQFTDPTEFRGTPGQLWRLRIPEGMVLSAATAGSNFDSVLRSFAQDEDGHWQLLGEDDDGGGGRDSLLQLTGQKGDILLQLSDLGGETEGLRWRLRLDLLRPAEGNDRREEAVDIGEATDAAWSGNTDDVEVDPQEEGWGGMAGKGRGVWWKFTAPADGDVVVDTKGSSFDTVLYSAPQPGPGEELSQDPLFDDDGGQRATSKLVVPMKQGDTQLFMLDTLNEGGNYRFRFQFFPGGRPQAANATMATALPLGGVWPMLLRGDSEHAEPGTAEEEVGAQGHGHGLWWSFTPQETGQLRLDFSESAFPLMVHLYRKDLSIDQWQRAQSVYSGNQSSGEGALPVRRGEDYLLLVESQNGEGGQVRLKLDWNPGAGISNDDFADSLDLGRAERVEVTADLRGSTIEQNEPSYTSPPNSVWFHWTAPRDGQVLLRASPKLSNPRFSTYSGVMLPLLVGRGERLDDLETLWDYSAQQAMQEIAPDVPWVKDSALVDVTAGETLRIQLQNGMLNYGVPELVLSLQLLEGDLDIPNDDLAGAIEILELPSVTQLSTKMSGVEEWETAAWPGVKRSLWWRFTAPRDVHLEVNLSDAGGETAGKLALARLGQDGQPVIFDQRDAQGGPGAYWFGPLRAGETIYLGAGAGADGAVSSTLLVSELPQKNLPKNDQFAQAADLGRTEKFSEHFQLRYASREEGEEVVGGQNHDTAPRSTLWYRWQAPRGGVLQVGGMGMGGAELRLLTDREEQAVGSVGAAWVRGARSGAGAGRKLSNPSPDPAADGGVPREFGQLTSLANGNLSPALWGGGEVERLLNPVRAGQIYWVQVSEQRGGGQSWSGMNPRLVSLGRLDLELLPPVDGDFVAQPLRIPENLPASVKFGWPGATLEPWETVAGLEGRASVWLSTAAAADGWVKLASQASARVELFSPGSNGGWEKRSEDLGLAPGTALLVQVGPQRQNLLRISDLDAFSYGMVSGDLPEIELELSASEAALAPANDALAAALRVDAYPFEDQRNLALASHEGFESDGQASVWYRLLIPTAGTLQVSTTGSDFDTLVELYPADTDPQQLSDQLLAANDDDPRDSSGTTSFLEQPVEAGAELWLRVSNYGSVAVEAGAAAEAGEASGEATSELVAPAGTLAQLQLQVELVGGEGDSGGGDPSNEIKDANEADEGDQKPHSILLPNAAQETASSEAG